MLLLNDNYFKMKKIKIMHHFVLGLIILFVLYFIGNIYVTFLSDFLYQFDNIHDNFIFGYYTQFVGIFLSVFTFIGLIYVKRGLSITLRNDVFNNRSSVNFINSAKYFLISGILGGAFDVAVFIYSKGSIYALATFGQNFLLVILALVLYIIADIIENGNELKLDNDLTI